MLRIGSTDDVLQVEDINISVPLVFDPAKVTTLSLQTYNSIGRTTADGVTVITVQNLAL